MLRHPHLIPFSQNSIILEQGEKRKPKEQCAERNDHCICKRAESFAREDAFVVEYYGNLGAESGEEVEELDRVENLMMIWLM